MKRRTIIAIAVIAVAVVATGGFVMNKGKEGRINFIFDYIPPQHLGQAGHDGQSVAGESRTA